MSKKRTRILVCTKGKKCKKRGSNKIFDAIKTASKKDDNSPDVVGCKCLGMCKNGPAVVVVPAKQKYKKVKTKDASRIVSAANSKTRAKPTKKNKRKK